MSKPSKHIIEIRALMAEDSNETSVVSDEDEYKQRKDELSQRSKKITETLHHLTRQQVERYSFRHIMQVIIVIFFMLIVLALTIAIIVCISYILRTEDLSLTNSLIVLISSCVTYLTSVISIVTIIVKYIFPENEDKLLSEIVPKILDEEKIFLQDGESTKLQGEQIKNN